MSTDLQELFSRDPLSYTKDGNELTLIIAEMRKRRQQFTLGNMKAGSTKPITAAKKEVLSIVDKLTGLDL